MQVIERFRATYRKISLSPAMRVIERFSVKCMRMKILQQKLDPTKGKFVKENPKFEPRCVLRFRSSPATSLLL